MKEYNFWTWLPSLNFVRGLSFVTLAFITLIMYKQMGLSNSEITFYTSWLYLPYILKPLLRFFMKLWKSCRWWIVTLELLIGASFGGVAFMIPTSFWLQGTMFFFWLMAFASATHDIAIDEFYLLGIDKYNKAWFVGIRYTFYRLATIFGQGILVMIAGNLQVIYRNSISYSWSLMFYGITGIFIALWLLHHYALPTSYEDILRKDVNVNTIWQEFLNTIKTFLKNEQMKAGVLFMFLFLMPEGLLAKVSALFLIDAAHNGGMGLSPQEYGLVQGTVGVIGLTLGGILGGICAGKDGLKKWLWPMVCAITLPDIVYVYLSYALNSSLAVINVCVFIEQFGYGFGFTAYMLYLIYYSRGEFKTSHYALCTAFMALSMMIPGLFAGALQEAVGYHAFFIIVMFCCAVTFLVTSCLKIDADFGKKETNT